MSEDTKRDVDTSSAHFKLGGEAGLNSAVDSKNQTGNELGQELQDEVTKKEPVSVFKETPRPLFMADSSDGNKGNAQDEKDESEE